MPKVTYTPLAGQGVAEIRREMVGRVTTATAVLHRETVKAVSRSGPPRSKPGEPPRVDTARLRQSIQPSVVDEGSVIRGRVGTNVEYAPLLEYGTSKMAPRPFLRSTLAKQSAGLLAILQGKPRAG
jgi:HK97 gp10 family phage protein